MDNRSIAAIATGAGEAGIGIVRVSGDEAFEIADRVFERTGKSPLRSHRIYYGRLLDPDSREMIDDALLLTFQAPHSYTGEHTIELSCHGGSVVLRKALEACLKAGARLAEAGEFTKRAFLNGKLDLAQAEAVADLIRSQTDAQHRMALRQKEGALSRRITTAADQLLGVLAHVEATIDFSEDIGEMDYTQIALETEAVKREVDALLESASQGRVLREGLNLAIVGKPNVGKSSLMNALLGRERAIVTAIPGTTRDVIEEPLNLKGIPVLLSDTAGIRETKDVVEAIGVERTHRTLAEADLVLFLLSAEGIDEEDHRLWSALGGKQTLIALNKSDLIQNPQILEQAQASFGQVLAVSALNGSGLDALQQAILNKSLMGNVSYENAAVSNARHQDALRQASESLEHAQESLQSAMPPDFVSIDLRGALDALGLISGQTATEDIVNRIFQDFCIGK